MIISQYWKKIKKQTNIDVQIWCGRIHTEMFPWCIQNWNIFVKEKKKKKKKKRRKKKKKIEKEKHRNCSYETTQASKAVLFRSQHDLAKKKKEKEKQEKKKNKKKKQRKRKEKNMAGEWLLRDNTI